MGEKGETRCYYAVKIINNNKKLLLDNIFIFCGKYLGTFFYFHYKKEMEILEIKKGQKITLVKIVTILRVKKVIMKGIY